MVQTVVNSTQVAHLWASQTQTEARNASNSISFTSQTLHSYAMQIGHIIQKDYISIVLLNARARNRSNTTNQHLTLAQMATRHYVHNYIVPHINPYYDTRGRKHKENIDFLVDQYRVMAEKYEKATKSDNWNNFGRQELKNRLAAINGYCLIFDLEAQAIDYDADCAKIDARFVRLAALASVPKKVLAKQKRKAKRQAEKAEQERLEALSQLEKLTAWLEGAKVHLPWQGFKTPNGGAYLRVVGETLETSLGANVPLAEAIKVVKLVDRLLTKRIKAPFEPRMRVGSFHVDEVFPNGDIKAGCHLIEFTEMQRMCKLLDIPLNASYDAKLLTLQLVEGNHASF
jgi:hypothetical protein